MKSKIVCELVPNQENNRNSEGAFIQLENGKILFAYSRYGNKGGRDDAEADIFGIVSEDQGESFGAPFLIVDHAAVEAENVMSVSLLRMTNHEIGLFYLKKSAGGQCILYMIRSSDEGKSWSVPIRCIAEKGYFVVNNDRVIRTDSGRILFAAAYHKTEECCDQRTGMQRRIYKPGCLVVYGSDDDGFSWNRISSEDITLPISRGSVTGVQEPGILSLQDGSIWCYIRNDSGRHYECFSQDEGVTWTQPLPSVFTGPASPLCTKRLSDGRILAVWNPIPNYNGRKTIVNEFRTAGRNPLVMAFSEDDGTTWTEPVVIESDESRGYCYTAIIELEDGSVLLGYCAGGAEDKGILNRLRIRKINSV